MHLLVLRRMLVQSAHRAGPGAPPEAGVSSLHSHQSPTPASFPVVPTAGCEGLCGITVSEGQVAHLECKPGLKIVDIPVGLYGAIYASCIARNSHRYS